MKTNLIALITRILTIMLCVICIAFILIFIYSFVNRINYPYDLEWIEGASADNVQRILDGQQIYDYPTTVFVPFIYTPLYFYVCAIISKIIGFGYFTMRLISVLSTIGCCLLISSFVYRITKSKFSSLISFSFFIACYNICGAWYDLARLDMLLVLFLLIGIYMLYYSKSYISIIIAGLFFALAFFTKQNTLLIIILAFSYSIIRGFKYFLTLLLTTIISIILGIFIFNSLSNGWFGYYIYTLTVDIFKETFNYNRLITIWTKDFFGVTAIAFSLSIFYIIYNVINKKIHEWSFDILLFSGFILVSFINRIIIGGYLNALIPFYAFVAIAFGVSSYNIYIYSKNNNPIYVILLNLLLLSQFITLIYDPTKLTPTKEDIKAGDHLVDTIKNINGQVIVLSHGQYSQRAGKPGSMHMSALDDILCSNDNNIRNSFIIDFRERLKNKEYGAIIVDNIIFIPEIELIKNIDEYYNKVDIKYDNGMALYTKSDMMTRPSIIYLPK